MTRPSEDALIARYFAPLAGAAGLGLRDDAALLAPSPGRDLVLTTDALAAGVHFFPDDPPDAIARKALRVNLSDLAAKGARPEGFLLTLALPSDWREPWLAAFAEGLGADARGFACPLIGGDTVRTSGPLLVSITAVGSVAAGRMTRRDGAQPGDLLYVTGTIGDAALGLLARAGSLRVDAASRTHLVARYLEPQPRLAIIAALVRDAHAAMDVSDGLIGDLTKMMGVAGVGARIEAAAIPLSPAARAAIGDDEALWRRAVTGGDDYEILCAVAPQNAGRFAAAAGVSVTRIGHVTAAPAVVVTRADGTVASFEQTAYQHF